MSEVAAATELEPGAERRLVELARASVAAAASTGTAPAIRIEDEPPALRLPGATFVTLRVRGVPQPASLRGCIGSIVPSRPLALDVNANAAGAALRDPRFPPVQPGEVGELVVSVSVLSPFETVHARSEAELLAALRPGVDGLLIRDGVRRAVFLPQVWEQLPAPSAFLDALRQKAGLTEGWWSPTFEAERFTVRHLE